MAAVLLDIDGVLQISGEALTGAVAAVRRVREDGHKLRFVSNSATRSQAALASELRALGVELADDELQTTTRVAKGYLGDRRVLALTMAAVIEDLDGVALVGEHADAVLIGGADETPETHRVFSYMNLARAFAEVDAGAELVCLHRNRWWQTSRGPMLDAGAFVAGLEYACGIEGTVLGKPSPAYFAAAIEELGVSPGEAWMVGDDIDDDVDGAQQAGLKGVLVRTGKFRQEDLDRSPVVPDGVLDSISELPYFLERVL